MADSRHNTASTSNTRAPGRRANRQPPPPAPAQSIDDGADEDSERDSESNDPALQPYKRPDIPKFRGPAKAEKTARQFRPLSKLTPSVDEQWRIWDAEQLQLEREHNERREALLRARDSRRHRQGLPRLVVVEEEEDADVEEYHIQRRIDFAPQRRGRHQYAEDEEPDEEEPVTEMEEGIVGRRATPPELIPRNVPSRHERRRRIRDEDMDDESSPSFGPARSTKRRKQHEGESEDLYAPSGQRSPIHTPSPPRGPNRRLSELNIPRNRFEFDSYSTGQGVRPPRLGRSHPSRQGPPPPPPGYRPSHPGSMLPHPPQRRSEIPATFSPPRQRLHSQRQETPARDTRQESEPSSPGLFVSQSPAPPPPAAGESWPYAEVKDEPASDSHNESHPKTPPQYPETRDLETAYQEALDTIERQEEELKDKDREIERLKGIIRGERRNWDQDQYEE